MDLGFLDCNVGRVGGHLHQGADVGADLVGKVYHEMDEDSPRNPATIADNVGDNVGDVAGMGADLFGSFAESTCAALVIAAQTEDLRQAGWGAICFPIVVSCAGIIVCLACSFVATHIAPVTTESRIESSLRLQLILTTIIMVPATIYVGGAYLPPTFSIEGVAKSFTATREGAIMCVAAGTVGGLIIGLTTEYYTSHSYAPVRELANSCKTGAATNVIYGLALGTSPALSQPSSWRVSSTSPSSPVITGCLPPWVCWHPCYSLTIDAYGPVCDNAGGLAEMAELDSFVRDKTDALDAPATRLLQLARASPSEALPWYLWLCMAFVVRIVAVLTKFSTTWKSSRP